MARCPDCYSSGSAFFDIGDGKCASCCGTGKEHGALDQVADRLSHDFFSTPLGTDCYECHGSGKCQTCDGTGEVEQETSYSVPNSSGAGGGGGEDSSESSPADYSSSYSSSTRSAPSSDSSVGWFGAFLIIIVLIIGAVVGFQKLNKETGPPLVDISSTPPSQGPAMYAPAIRMPNQNCVGLYLCTERNYNPDEWRVTRKTVSHTFDGGKTWHTVWETSRYIIREMKAVESQRPGERDVILIIEEP